MFYKKEKFRILRSEYQIFDTDGFEPSFLSHCLFQYIYDPAFRFVFGSTSLVGGGQ